jgi:hypothetical protein
MSSGGTSTSSGGGSDTGPSSTSGDGSAVTSGDGSAVTSGNYGQVSGSNGTLGDPANVGAPADSTAADATSPSNDVYGFSDIGPDVNFAGFPAPEAGVPTIGPKTVDSVSTDKSLSVDAKEASKDPSESQGLVGRIAKYNPNASPSSPDVSPSQLSAVADGKPLSFQRQSEVTGISTADANNAAGRPANYNPDNKTWQDRAFDATGVGMRESDFHNQESMTPGMREARNEKWGRAVNGVGMLALNSVPGMGIIRAGVDTINNVSQGQSLADAATNAGRGIVGGYLGSKINTAIGGAIGPQASAALSTYNRAATLANAVGGNVHTVDPGGMIAGSMLGRPPAPFTSSGGAGRTNMDGSHLPSANWSSAGSALASSNTTTPPVLQAPAVEVPKESTMATADPSLYGKASEASRKEATGRYLAKRQSRGW